LGWLLLFPGIGLVAGIFLIIYGATDFNIDWYLWAGIGLTAICLILMVIIGVRMFQIDRQTDKELDGEDDGIEPMPGVSQEVAYQASRYLDVLRFQQSFTSGWSGSLTAQVGPLEGGAGFSGGEIYEQRILSLPELVGEFQAFVRVVAKEGPVIIGIDELDKIESAEKAQRFLNDIKSIFGIDSCYFMISVSEDALANFERRGLPLRDAFDSALDDVVRVSPLNYRTSREFIRGRVVGLGEPYVALAYCLGGGLPRDMIRWTREFLRAEEDGMRSLTNIADDVLSRDLKAKTWASVQALSQGNSDQGDVAEDLELLSGLEVSANPEWLLSTCVEQRDSLIGRARTSRVLAQLFAYFYFVATVQEVFKDSLTAKDLEGLTEEKGPGTVTQLASARQTFSSDMHAAVRQISSFRSARALDHCL
jgi:hypothetical protein